MRSRETPGADPADPLGRVLAVGLYVFVVAAPFPFGSVIPAGRLALECAAFLLLAVWLLRLLARATVLPPLAARVGLFGLLGIAALQTLPLGEPLLRALSPWAERIRLEAAPSDPVRNVESQLLGAEPAWTARATLSVDAPRTASALRTGAAFASVLLVATTVVADTGAGGLALALLVGAAFQGLYGTLVLASGHPVIWNVPKKYYVDCATGTFVNRNHFAGYLAAALPAGLALAIRQARRLPGAEGLRERLVQGSTAQGAAVVGIGLLLAVGASGLFLSFSRTGVALGVGAIVLTLLAAGRHGLRARAIVLLLLLGVAFVPLLQIGADRLARRYASAAEDLAGPTGRATVWRDSLGLVTAAPLFGVGFGAFEAAYPLVRSEEIRVRYEHAHNDALQLLVEGGAAAAACLLLLLLALGREVVASFAGRRGTLAVGLAAGVVVLALHALVDFNFHIPSNGATAAALAGAVWGNACRVRA